jgi:hypothetical protein
MRNAMLLAPSTPAPMMIEAGPDFCYRLVA